MIGDYSHRRVIRAHKRIYSLSMADYPLQDTEKMRSKEEEQEAPDEQPVTPRPLKGRQANLFPLILVLAAGLVTIYFGWRIVEYQREVSQIQQTNRGLQEDVAELKKTLENTAGQLDLALNAVTLARIHRDEGQKALREMEGRLADSREAREALEAKGRLDQAEIEYLSKALTQVEAALREVKQLPDYQYTGNPLEVTEYISGTHPTQNAILGNLLENWGDIKWRYMGNDPKEGLDSLGMAALVLSKCGLTSSSAREAREQIPQILEAAEEPQIGDLVSYPGDYFMFFFQDQDGVPFVAGMTPFGVQVFLYEFKEIEEIYRVPYSEETQCEFDNSP